MEYTKLSPESRQSVFDNTLANIEAEHYAMTLALTRAEAIEDEAQVQQFREALERLDKQYAALVDDGTPEA